MEQPSTKDASVGGPATPRTRALQALIDSSVEQLLSDDVQNNDGLLFLGSWQESIPRLLVVDPVLRAGEVRLWMYLKISSRAGAGASFPSYQAIRAALQVSGPTIANALAVLRITRWVTLCRRVRDPSGRFRGNVYALHDEPPALADTLFLDPEYMRFLEASAQSHRNRRVRNVARGLLASLEAQIGEGADILDDSTLAQADRRAEAMAFFAGGPGQGANRRFFGFSQETVAQIGRNETTESNETNETNGRTSQDVPEPDVTCARRSLRNQLDRLKKLKLDGDRLKKLKPAGDRLKNFKSADTDLKNLSDPPKTDLKNLTPLQRSSSCCFYINKTTTTTTTTETEENSARVRDAVELPNDLSANEREILHLHLKSVPQAQRQGLIDEWDARRRAGLNRNDLSWLAWAAHQIRRGNLTVLTSFALNAERRRRRERVLRERDRQAIAALSQAGGADAGGTHGAPQGGADPKGAGRPPNDTHENEGEKT